MLIATVHTKTAFIKNEKRWVYPFRFGHFEIEEKDFKLIAEKMVDVKGD